MRRVRAATGHLPAVRHAVTMVKSVRSSRAKIVAVARSARITPRGDRPNFNRDDRPPRARRSRRCASGRAFVRQEIRRQEALYPARRRRREAALHAARRRFSQGRRPSAWRSAVSVPGRRAMAIVPVAIGPSENSAATRNSRAARPIAARARILAIVPSAAMSKPWQKREDRGERDSRPARDGARNFDKPRFDRSARRSRRRRASALFAFARGSSRNSTVRRADGPAGRTDWQEHPRSEVA